MAAVATLGMLGIDCADPRALAAFYGQVLGWTVVDGAEYSMVQGDGMPIIFWKIADHRPPAWPPADIPKQFHLDLMVDDLDAAEARCLQLGATKPDHQPGTDWRVLLDPAGHPFCICQPG